MYQVDRQQLIGKPETPPAFIASFKLEFDGYGITLTAPLHHKYARPDRGELTEPFNILPKATVKIADPVLIFNDDRSRQIPVTVKANMDNLTGQLALQVADGWKVQEQDYPVSVANKGDEKTFMFTLSPPPGESESEIRPVLTVDGHPLSKELITIAYDHIPTQNVLMPASSKVVRLNIQKTGENVGYIAGAGDNIPESLRQIGYIVHPVDPAGIHAGSLDPYDAIVVGIRAYNVVDELKFKQHFLLDYVKNGGTLIVQYNTVGRDGIGIDNIAPYKLELSRDRVVDEHSDVTFLAAHNPLLQYPNNITADDFKGWVQERGLYFPDSWDSAFTPVLSMHDTGEDPEKGSLLVAPYGKGYYIYTGLSFFRELPAGVPGAYKLFANMLSIGSHKAENANAVKG